mgnify:FL=1|tara:strand:+ start:307 stop:534 length:228 start_codon:yes stop_codon:yes gene_type:complete
MPTKNIVPRANGEGGIGTTAKNWASGSFHNIAVSTKISGSAAASASFGRIDGKRILEDGTSVTDHGTAMAIVFGG